MNAYIRLTSLVLVLLFLATGTSLGGNKNRIGTAGAPELLIPVGARGIAMGGSTLSSVTGVDAIYWNPAGLVRANRDLEIMVSEMVYFADINVAYAAVGARLGSVGSLGLSIKSLSFGDIPVTTVDMPDGTGATFSPGYVNVGLTYATQLIDRVSVGLTATYISHTIMSTSEGGFAFNFGIQYVGLAVPGLSLGVTIKNVGSSLRYEGSDLYQQVIYQANPTRTNELLSVKAATNELPATLQLGVGYHHDLDENFAGSVEGIYVSNGFNNDEYKLGVEVGYNKMFFLRGGYTLMPDAGTDIGGEDRYLYSYTVGAGYHADLGSIQVGVDYTYQAMKYFDGNHIVSLVLGI
jgi:hypothetical protein